MDPPATIIGGIILQSLKLCRYIYNRCNETETEDDNNDDNIDANNEDNNDDKKDEKDDKKEDEGVDQLHHDDDDNTSTNENEAEEKEESDLDTIKKYSKKTETKNINAKKKRRIRYNDKEPVTTQPVASQPVVINNTVQPIFNNYVYQPVPTSSNPPGVTQPTPPNGTVDTDSAASTQSCSSSLGVVEWVCSSTEKAFELIDRALVGGYDVDETDLWIIRARFKGAVVPGKLNQHHKLGFALYEKGDKYLERNVDVFQVLCIAPESKHRIKWIKCKDGDVPRSAVDGGRTSKNEKLYIGRVFHKDDKYLDRRSLCPGMIQPSHGVLYITYGLEVHAYRCYEVLCIQ